jgi:hypothetical protein
MKVCAFPTLTSISAGRGDWRANITQRSLTYVDGVLYHGQRRVKNFSVKLHPDGRTFDVGVAPNQAKIKFRFP